MIKSKDIENPIDRLFYFHKSAVYLKLIDLGTQDIGIDCFQAYAAPMY